MHMMAILISDVVLTVKVGKELGEQFKTEVGIAQGDCLSAVLFIFYLAKSLTPNRECIEHNYASAEQCGNILPEECKDHDYFRKTETKNYFEIDPKYADDITWATTAKQRITYIKETTPSTLAKRNLVINESKTEEYEIIRQGNEKWKKCKLLGSLLDTEKDINRRQILAIDAFKTLHQIFDSRKISNAVKIRTFNAYVASVFLYNSELWTLTKKLENAVNTFQASRFYCIFCALPVHICKADCLLVSPGDSTASLLALLGRFYCACIALMFSVQTQVSTKMFRRGSDSRPICPIIIII